MVLKLFGAYLQCLNNYNHLTSPNLLDDAVAKIRKIGTGVDQERGNDFDQQVTLEWSTILFSPNELQRHPWPRFQNCFYLLDKLTVKCGDLPESCGKKEILVYHLVGLSSQTSLCHLLTVSIGA